MSQFTVHNCNASTALRVEAATLGANPWVRVGPTIGPGGEYDFDSARQAGAIRLASVNQSITSGIYIFTTEIELSDIYFRTSGLVSSVACSGSSSSEEITRVTVNNCLSSQLVLLIQTADGTNSLRNTSLRIPAVGSSSGPVTINLPIQSIIGFNGTNAPSTTYTVTGNETDIYINSDSIGTGGCVMPPIGDQLFLFGNCFSQLAVLQLLNTNGGWTNVTDSNNNLVTAASGSAGGVPQLIGQTSGIYRIQPRNQSASAPFLYTNSSQISNTSQIWFRGSSPLITSNTNNACGSSLPGQVVVLSLRNCSGTAVTMSVLVSNLQGGSSLTTTNLTIPAGTGISGVAPQFLGVFWGSTIAFSNSAGLIGSTFAVNSTLSATTDLYIGPNQVGTTSAVCTGGGGNGNDFIVVPTVSIFTASNCFTNPSGSCTAGMADNGAWLLRQVYNGSVQYESCIPSSGQIMVPGTPISSTPTTAQLNIGNGTTTINSGLFFLFTGPNVSPATESIPFVYTSDVPPSNVGFSSNNVTNTAACSATGNSMVLLKINNCNSNNSITLNIQASGNFINVTTIAASSSETLAFMPNSVIKFTGTDVTDNTYTVGSDTEIYVGTDNISTNSCDDANVRNGNPITRNPWVFAIIVGLTILAIIIIFFLIFRGASSGVSPGEEVAPNGEVQIYSNPQVAAGPPVQYIR